MLAPYAKAKGAKLVAITANGTSECVSGTAPLRKGLC